MKCYTRNQRTKKKSRILLKQQLQYPLALQEEIPEELLLPQDLPSNLELDPLELLLPLRDDQLVSKEEEPLHDMIATLRERIVLGISQPILVRRVYALKTDR